MTLNENESDVTFNSELYKILNKVEPYLPTIFIGGAAFAAGGLPMGLIGITFSVLDIAAQKYNIYEKPYLAAGVLGYAFVNKLNIPGNHDRQNLINALNIIKNIAGSALGIVIVNGSFNDKIEILATPLQNLMLGTSLSGPIGGATGFVLGLVDEYLSSQDITHKNWFSDILRSAAMSNLIIPRILYPIQLIPITTGLTLKLGTGPALASSLPGIILAASQKFYSNQEIHMRWAPFNVQEQIYKFCSGVIPKQELDSFLQSQFLISIASQLSIQIFISSMSQYRQKIASSLETGNTDAFFSYYKILPLPLSGMLFLSWVDSLIKSYFSDKLRYSIANAIQNQLFQDENLLKLNYLKAESNTSSETLIRSIYSDSSRVSSTSKLTIEAFSLAAIGYHSGIYLLLNNAPDIIIWNYIYNEVTKRISKYISYTQSSQSTLFSELQTKTSKVVEFARANAAMLAQQNDTKFIGQRFNQIISNLREIEEHQNIWSIALNNWYNIIGWTNYLFNYYIVGMKIQDNYLSKDEWVNAIQMSTKITELISWEGTNAASLKDIGSSISRLNQMLAIVEKDPNITDPYLTSYGEGYAVRRIVQKTYNLDEPQSICFNNFTVGVGSKDNVLTSSNSTCMYGNMIAVTGDSGSGKSTALKIIKGIRWDNAWGNGTIIVRLAQPKDELTVYMSSQEPIIPPHVTYLEYLSSDFGAEAESKKSILSNISLDLGLSLPSLNKDTGSVQPSGGQKKKLSIIKAFIKGCNDIIIFDEPFSGLDPKSVKKAEDVLKKYCASSIKIIVDHDLAARNKINFYDSHIHFSNSSKTINLVKTSYKTPEGGFTIPKEDISSLTADTYQDVHSISCPSIVGVTQDTCIQSDT